MAVDSQNCNNLYGVLPAAGCSFRWDSVLRFFMQVMVFPLSGISRFQLFLRFSTWQRKPQGLWAHFFYRQAHAQVVSMFVHSTVYIFITHFLDWYIEWYLTHFCSVPIAHLQKPRLCAPHFFTWKAVVERFWNLALINLLPLHFLFEKYFIFLLSWFRKRVTQHVEISHSA